MNLCQKIILGTGILVLGLMTLFPPVEEVHILQEGSHKVHADNIIYYKLFFTISSAKNIVFTRLLIQYAIVIAVTFFLTAFCLKPTSNQSKNHSLDLQNSLLPETHKQSEQKSQLRFVKQHPIDEIIYKNR